MSITWTRAAVEALGPVTDVPTTAAIFGVHADTVYGQIRRGEWTATRVLTLGRKIKIPTRDLIAVLYAPEPDAEPAAYAEQPVPSECHPPENMQVKSSAPHSQCGCTHDMRGAVHRLRGA